MAISSPNFPYFPIEIWDCPTFSHIFHIFFTSNVGISQGARDQVLRHCRAQPTELRRAAAVAVEDHLAVPTPLKNISQMEALFPIYGKMFQTTNEYYLG